MILALLNFLYNQDFEMTKDLALQIMKLSEVIGFPEFISLVEEFIIQELTLENCFEIVNECDASGLSELRKSVINFMGDNLTQICQLEGMKNLSKEVLLEIIARSAQK